MNKKDLAIIQADIKNNKIRQGYLYKRSKFLHEWRTRFIVLTSKFLYSFTDDSITEITDTINLKDIKYYKSYLSKQEKMVPASFEIHTPTSSFFLSGRTANEKWSWIMTFERVMDFVVAGESFYNKFDWIVAKGIDSQLDFENGGKFTLASIHETIDEEKKKLSQQSARKTEELFETLSDHEKAIERESRKNKYVQQNVKLTGKQEKKKKIQVMKSQNMANPQLKEHQKQEEQIIQENFTLSEQKNSNQET